MRKHAGHHDMTRQGEMIAMDLKPMTPSEIICRCTLICLILELQNIKIESSCKII